MKSRKSSAVLIFVGLLLLVVFVVGYIGSKNPDAFRAKYRYDYALDQFLWFCHQFWIPAGIIGFPLFLISLIVSLARESAERKKDNPY